MKYTKFGASGLTVSQVCLGTAPFGKQTDEETAYKTLDVAAEAGVNFIDTADAYPMGADLSLVGRTEEIVGSWLYDKRDQFIVAHQSWRGDGASAVGTGWVAKASSRCDRRITSATAN